MIYYLSLTYLWIILLMLIFVSPRIKGTGRIGLVAIIIGLALGIIGWLK